MVKYILPISVTVLYRKFIFHAPVPIISFVKIIFALKKIFCFSFEKYFNFFDRHIFSSPSLKSIDRKYNFILCVFLEIYIFWCKYNFRNIHHHLPKMQRPKMTQIAWTVYIIRKKSNFYIIAGFVIFVWILNWIFF